MQRTAILVLSIIFLTSPIDAQPKEKPKWPPNPNVAATEALRPEAQKTKIKLPKGFELQLVAADPDIRKPINIAFDAAGRLWVAETIEYPYAAKDGQGRDAVKILEDFAPDGRARKITTFADKLNIPIGVLPTSKGALVFSIPSIYHMIDTKGLGKADQRDVYYGKFGVDDTHGMTGEFMHGFDGWIYACHGYRNESTVFNRDKTASIKMTSGNTYRIKPDGSRIEQWTWGQVNPFGLAFDPYGNLYSGDCHSEPLTMLLRGGGYKSFGRPHDGLGFAPHMNTFGKEHSTALCGVAYYAADQYPAEYDGKMFLGDVVENRINAYRIEWTGATPRAVFEPFLTSSDPWFRPVDIKLGPDGCLYFADFYNRIIGHYEVALDHPGRDRDKGRIWRIVYRGQPGEPPASAGGVRPVRNLAKADVKTLVATLADANLTVRLQATHQLVERGADTAASLLPIVKNIEQEGDGFRKAHALWVLERLGKLDDDTLAQASSAKEKAVRVHAFRILAEKKNWTPRYAAMARFGMDDKDAIVRLAAVESLAAHPAAEHVRPLASRWPYVDEKDTHLVYAVRAALRNQLRNEEAWKAIRPPGKSDRQFHRAIADVCFGVQNEPSARYLRMYLNAFDEGDYNWTSDAARYVIRHGPADSTSWMLGLARSRGKLNLVSQGVILKAAVQGAQERGIKLSPEDIASAESMIIELLETPRPDVKQTGAELAGTLKLARTHPHILQLVNKAETPESLRKACITSLVAIDAKNAVEPLTQMLLNDKEAIAIREQTANALAGTNHPEAHAALVKALQDAPARLQNTIALGMAGTPQGGERLLQAVEAGKASRHLLQDRAIEQRLSNAKIANVKIRLKSLTQGLPAANEKTQALIAKRASAFASFKTDAEQGQKVFAKHCGNCHQIAG
ncbi:MAG: HEAT repeat domain-containing protein, partial [Planctomycetes bacterium]|nr:HEAT repeat domain-containing protein [Planctomycetota bacterium]